MLPLEPNMQAQEDLIALFSRNLTLDPVSASVPTPAPAQAPVDREEPKIVYASQHYTHSAHIVPQELKPSPVLTARPASEPPHADHLSVHKVLESYGVDPTVLSAAQLQLFKTVADPQKERLIELWRHAPPTSSHDNPTLAWSMTSMDQEELFAKERYERKQQLQQQQQQQQSEQSTIMSLDGTPLTPVQVGDGRWVMATDHYMEPYMASGYEEMALREYEESARRAMYAEAMERPKDIYSHFGTAIGGPTYNPRHSDPVYRGSGGVDWTQEGMADQYGRLMALRGVDHEMMS